MQSKGYKVIDLKEAKIYISDNPGLDIAYIETKRYKEPQLFCEDGEAECFNYGISKIPAFLDFLTVEKATISCKNIARITPTKGAIVTFGTEYLAQIDALLQTAKVLLQEGNTGSFFGICLVADAEKNEVILSGRRPS